MRVLLDECLPGGLKRALVRHNVVTVPEAGWAGTKNGALLVTADQNVEYQQNLRSQTLGIIVLVAPNNRLDTLLPLVPQLLQTLQAIQPGDLTHISATD